MIRTGCLIVGLWSIYLLPAQAVPTLTTTPTINAGQLDLDGEGNASTHVVKVADIALSTDNSSGLTLTISSGDIDRIGGQPISFQVTTVTDNASPPNSGDFSTPSGNNYTYVTGSVGTENRDVYILYTPLPFQDPGSYTSSVDLSVTDN
ncbi:hypothetical protein [Adonisia turfae]|uniref:Uncharacterized protein n=1 Tax=Adonisia turfae CCMR0081 TaxID=2292702 RepID=A0A6M0RQ74_9CYAN|nr:hypothetical protein [Adonisia turfae]NEZ57851.1 hypothetical protein [Adonisia turfae CCMR0081]